MVHPCPLPRPPLLLLLLLLVEAPPTPRSHSFSRSLSHPTSLSSIFPLLHVSPIFLTQMLVLSLPLVLFLRVTTQWRCHTLSPSSNQRYCCFNSCSIYPTTVRERPYPVSSFITFPLSLSLFLIYTSLILSKIVRFTDRGI